MDLQPFPQSDILAGEVSYAWLCFLPDFLLDLSELCFPGFFFFFEGSGDNFILLGFQSLFVVIFDFMYLIGAASDQELIFNLVLLCLSEHFPELSVLPMQDRIIFW